MATIIRMSALSPTMTEGRLNKWLVKVGDKVKAGQAIAEVETDKSNLEVETFDDGVVLAIAVEEGKSVPVNTAIAVIGQAGEALPALDAGAPVASGQTAAPVPQPTAPVPVTQPSTPAVAAEGAVATAAGTLQTGGKTNPHSDDVRLRASPLARKIAEEKGIALSQVVGTGPNGRVIRRDVESTLGAGATPVQTQPKGSATAELIEAGTRVELSQMRRIIAARLTEAKPGVPHFYLTIDVSMDAAMALKDDAKAQGVQFSVNDIVVKAAGVALQQSPAINRIFRGDHILQFTRADVGVAIAIEDGLITPLVRDVASKSLTQIGAEVKDFAARAKTRSLKPTEYQGGALSVSNLGMYGIDEFSAVINPPQSAILAVGRVQSVPVVEAGQIVIRQRMKVTASGDHRVVDGASLATYLGIFKKSLEQPARMLW